MRYSWRYPVSVILRWPPKAALEGRRPMIHGPCILRGSLRSRLWLSDLLFDGAHVQLSLRITLGDGVSAYNSSTNAARLASTARWLIEPLSVASPLSSDGGSAIGIRRSMRVEEPLASAAKVNRRSANNSRTVGAAMISAAVAPGPCPACVRLASISVNTCAPM